MVLQSRVVMYTLLQNLKAIKHRFSDSYFVKCSSDLSLYLPMKQCSCEKHMHACDQLWSILVPSQFLLYQLRIHDASSSDKQLDS